MRTLRRGLAEADAETDATSVLGRKRLYPIADLDCKRPNLICDFLIE